MCDQGVFKDYDFAVMVHVSPTRTNANSHFLALDDYRIAFHGQTAHAAGEPWNGRNALNGAMLALHAVDMLRQHVRPETRIGSYIVNGGAASNVVPDYAEVECCIRHSEREYLDTVVAKVMNCFKGAAIATETTYDVTQMGCKFDNMVWNEAATKASEQVLQAMGIPYEEPKDCGSSDVGNVSHQCPATWPWATSPCRNTRRTSPMPSRPGPSNRPSSKAPKSWHAWPCSSPRTRPCASR